ncbi:hypothetical protein D3C72_1669380 [compost metagenome]
MVSHLAAMSGKMIHTFFQRVTQRTKAANIDIRCRFQFLQVIIETRRINIERLVRPPAWQHLDVEAAVGRNRFMVAQIVDRIVGSTNHLHIHFLHDATRPEILLRQQGVAALPDIVRRRRGKQHAGNTERATQLQMGPVVKWVTQGVRHGGSPGVKLFTIAGITGTESLSHTVGAHCPPFVVIAL